MPGIIPACAGSTHHWLGFRLSTGDHPRMCGEHVLRMLLLSCARGSSPHVRGAPGNMSVRIRLRGIIPACAGSTCRRLWDCHRSGDHPRMCGEHSVKSPRHDGRSGSSPHVRGALLPLSPSCHRCGIIPACAGSTSRPGEYRDCKRDHPRMCGEHFCPAVRHPARKGSSPHVRGARGRVAIVLTLIGIIPACAGSTHCCT